jgi:hypothetical protein
LREIQNELVKKAASYDYYILAAFLFRATPALFCP